MRSLATIRTIADIQPIDGADAIEVATIDGWQVVSQKGLYSPGDMVIYLEIDSWVPHSIAPFLTKNSALPREYLGVKGERLRTIKLRGQVSQGLMLPLSILSTVGTMAENPQDDQDVVWFGDGDTQVSKVVGFDVTDFLGINKWEPPISAQLQGVQKGNFPSHIVPKTDQERIQNCFKHIARRDIDTYEVSMKLDGSSCTLLNVDGEIRACSRNMELKVGDMNAENTFVKMAIKYGDIIPKGYAFQGELMGPGVQGNRENLPDHELFIFDIYDIENQVPLTPLERRRMVSSIGMTSVPIISESGMAPASVVEALVSVDKMPSLSHKIAEGVVFKSNTDPNFSFKVISNRFLIKGGD